MPRKAHGGPIMRHRLRLHVRTTWLPHSERTAVFYCLAGISLTRPTLRTTWDTDIASVYYTARRVARRLWVQESRPGLTGQVTYDPPH